MTRPGADWSARISVNGNSLLKPGTWLYDKGGPRTGPGPGNIMAGLTVGWKFPDDGLEPTAKEPTTAQFSIIVEDVEDVRFIDIGAPVHMDFYLGVDDGAPTFTPLPSVTFDGRVAQMDGSPQRINGHDGYQLDIVAVDYTADLGEKEVAGVIPFQGVGAQVWVESLFQLAGMDPPDWNGGGWGCAQLTVDGGTVAPAALGEAVDRILSSYADAGAITGAESNPMNHDWYPLQGWRRGVVQPDVNAATGLLEGYRIDWMTLRNTVGSASNADTFPLGLRKSGAFFQLVLENPIAGTVNARQVIRAAYLDFRANWKRTKNSKPTTVIVACNAPQDGSVLADPWTQVQRSTTEDRPQVATRVTDFMGYNRFNAEFTAEMLLPDPSPYRDTAEGFTYYADQDPQWPLVPSWFPSQAQLWFGYSLPILITGIPASQSPADDRGWYVGTLNGAAFTIDPGGTFRFDFTLSPGAPMPGGFASTSLWSYMRADQTTVNTGLVWTPANTTSTLTVADFRLARRYNDSP